MRLIVLFAIITSFTFSASCAKEKPKSDNHQIEGFQWNGTKTLSNLARVEVNNPFGSVNIKTTSDSKAAVVAHIQRNKQATTRVKIDVDETGDKVIVSLAYPDKHFNNPLNRFDRVDLAIIVPEGRTAVVSTTEGQIKAKRIHADIEATTVTGGIKISTSGSVSARTESGMTNVEFTETKWRKNNSLRSESGAIKAKFKSAANLKLTATSEQGDIRFTNAQGSSQSMKAKLNMAFGEGGTKLLITTKTGDVNLSEAGQDLMSTSSTPTISNKDLRQLPKPKKWQPGDPIKEVPKGKKRSTDPSVR